MDRKIKKVEREREREAGCEDGDHILKTQHWYLKVLLNTSINTLNKTAKNSLKINKNSHSLLFK